MIQFILAGPKNATRHKLTLSPHSAYFYLIPTHTHQQKQCKGEQNLTNASTSVTKQIRQCCKCALCTPTTKNLLDQSHANTHTHNMYTCTLAPTYVFRAAYVCACFRVCVLYARFFFFLEVGYKEAETCT